MAYQKSNKTRQKIIDVSKQLFMEKGFNATGLREICRESEVNHSLIYYYFPNGKYDIAMMINTNFRKRCKTIFDSFYKDDFSMLYILAQFRFMYRELIAYPNEDDFYHESWYDKNLKGPLLIEMYTAAQKDKIKIDIELAKKAAVAADWSYNGFFKMRNEGSITISNDEVYDMVDIIRLTLMGYKKEDVVEIIKKANEIVNNIPICNIRLFS